MKTLVKAQYILSPSTKCTTQPINFKVELNSSDVSYDYTAKQLKAILMAEAQKISKYPVQDAYPLAYFLITLEEKYD